MPKPRVAQRIKSVISKNPSNNNSENLVFLTNQFIVLKDRLKLLVAAVKAHHGSLVQINKTRLEVAKQIVALSGGSPIHDVAGKLPPSNENGEVLTDSDVNSFASIHILLSGKHQAYADKYLKFVVNYAIEWERVVVSRVSTQLKTARVLQQNLNHYQSKVESIRQGVNVTLAKGKQVDQKTADRLKRNEDKYSIAKREYEDFASDLCTLIEEVTQRSWKDLHPMLIKMAQFDATLSNDEASSLSNLNQVVSVLKQLAQKHGLQPSARLKEIETLTAKMISTKQADEYIENGSNLSIQDDSSVGSTSVLTPKNSSTPNNSTTSDPWGTGKGGYASAPASGQSVSGMLAVAAAAAPPPTMEQLEESVTGMRVSAVRRESGVDRTGWQQSSNGSLPPQSNSWQQSSNGSLPPLPPYHMTSSYTAPPDQGPSAGYDSDTTRSISSSGPVAPAPAAPPPPPPPPSSLSMYSNYSMNPPAPAPAPPVYDAWPTNNATPPISNHGPTPGAVNPNPFDHPQDASNSMILRGGPGVPGSGTNPFGF